MGENIISMLYFDSINTLQLVPLRLLRRSNFFFVLSIFFSYESSNLDCRVRGSVNAAGVGDERRGGG